MSDLIVRYHHRSWWVYDEKHDSDTGPYSTYEQAQEWIDNIEEDDS